MARPGTYAAPSILDLLVRLAAAVRGRLVRSPLGSSKRRQHFRRPHMPDSFEGFRLRSCCLAILIETGSKTCSHAAQHSGRPHEP